MDIKKSGNQFVERIEQQVLARTYRASNELRTAAQYVLRGKRSGRKYRIPFTGGKKGKGRYYTASAPGEAPANRTGTFRNSWWARPGSTHRSGNKMIALPGIYTPFGKLADLLDKGTSRMSPRPYAGRIKERAWPKIQRIYRAPYY